MLVNACKEARGSNTQQNGRYRVKEKEKRGRESESVLTYPLLVPAQP